MYYLVYKITNKINGKYYIGKHETENKNDDYWGSGKLIKAAIKKYGIENFTREILCECANATEAYKMEDRLIIPNEIDSQSYNIVGAGWYKGKPFYKGDPRTSKGRETFLKLFENEEFRKSFNETMKEAKKRYLKKYGKEWWVGRKHTQKTKDKIGKKNSLNQTGKRNSQFGTMWINNPNTKEYKRISKNETIPSGWIAGRKGYSK